MDVAADSVDLVAREERGVDLEPGDVAEVARLGATGVPIAGDLGGVRLVEDWVEDGLLGQARRKRRIAARADEREFDGPDWAIEGDGVACVARDVLVGQSMYPARMEAFLFYRSGCPPEDVRGTSITPTLRN
jgi:hypothetical protein